MKKLILFASLALLLSTVGAAAVSIDATNSPSSVATGHGEKVSDLPEDYRTDPHEDLLVFVTDHGDDVKKAALTWETGEGDGGSYTAQVAKGHGDDVKKVALIRGAKKGDKKLHAPSKGRNPQTGKEIKIPAKKVTLVVTDDQGASDSAKKVGTVGQAIEYLENNAKDRIVVGGNENTGDSAGETEVDLVATDNHGDEVSNLATDEGKNVNIIKEKKGVADDNHGEDVSDAAAVLWNTHAAGKGSQAEKIGTVGQAIEYLENNPNIEYVEGNAAVEYQPPAIDAEIAGRSIPENTARKGRNPQTGKEIKIPAKSVKLFVTDDKGASASAKELSPTRDPDDSDPETP